MRLSSVLRAQAASLRVLDATSGALGVEHGNAALVLCPLLSVDGCALRDSSRPVGCHVARCARSLRRSRRTARCRRCGSTRACCQAPRWACTSHARSMATRRSLTSSIIQSSTRAARPSRQYSRAHGRLLSLRFTGVADATCEVLGTALGGGAGGGRRPALRELQLSGNRISTAGVEALTRCGLGGLHSLDLTVNLALDAGAALAIAEVVPRSEPRTLRLAACKVDKRGCSRLAAELVRPGCK